MPSQQSNTGFSVSLQLLGYFGCAARKGFRAINSTDLTAKRQKSLSPWRMGAA